jgi:hypothetical protein
VAPIESPIEPAARTGWVRVAVASGATAAGLAALLAGAAFGLQAVALPRPSNGQLIAAKTARWLDGQHAVESVALVRGRRVSSVCVNAVIGQLGGDLYGQKGSLLITGRLRLVETRFASFRLGTTFREEDGPLPAIRAVLAGCPRALERRIGRLLDNRVPIAVKRVFVRGAPMIRLSFQKPRGLLLLVDPRTFAPAEVRIARKRTGWSHLAPGEPRDLARPGLRLSRRLRLFVKEDA